MLKFIIVKRNHVINPELNSYLNIILEPMKLCEKNLKKKFIFIYVFVAVASFVETKLTQNRNDILKINDCCVDYSYYAKSIIIWEFF